MRKLYVTLNGKRAGPYPEAKVAAALRKGKLRGADFEDAETGEIVLEWDVVAPPSLPPIAQPEYAQPQDHQYYAQQPYQRRPWYKPDPNFDLDLKGWVLRRVFGFIYFWVGICVLVGFVALLQHCGIIKR